MHVIGGGIQVADKKGLVVGKCININLDVNIIAVIAVIVAGEGKKDITTLQSFVPSLNLLSNNIFSLTHVFYSFSNTPEYHSNTIEFFK